MLIYVRQNGENVRNVIDCYVYIAIQVAEYYFLVTAVKLYFYWPVFFRMRLPTHALWPIFSHQTFFSCFVTYILQHETFYLCLVTYMLPCGTFYACLVTYILPHETLYSCLVTYILPYETFYSCLVTYILPHDIPHITLLTSVCRPRMLTWKCDTNLALYKTRIQYLAGEQFQWGDLCN